VVVLLSLPLGWFGWKLREAERQRRAVEAIRKAGGYVLYDYHFGSQWDGSGLLAPRKPPGPAWLRRLVGGDFLADVFVVDFSDPLYSSFFPDTDVGDADFECLRGLTELRSLGLSSTQVTDAGLESIRGLTELTRLNLSDTSVTKGGIKELQEALPNCEIIWDDQP